MREIILFIFKEGLIVWSFMRIKSYSMERFFEEEEGLSPQEAIRVSLSKVGQAITASGLTVIVGFLTLIFVNFPVLIALFQKRK
jgi:uncharacterized membrane protein YdfJ with MMPL/SSD domain